MTLQLQLLPSVNLEMTTVCCLPLKIQKNEARQQMHIMRDFILMELDTNRDESRVFSRLHGDRPCSQPMIWQSKDK